jgi:cytochrome oxidase Cu insertion factor (SCO1/SenC/PrrC family)
MTETKNLSLEQRAMQGAAMTPEERKRMWLSISDITEAQFDALRAEQEARQINVPQPGAITPDFELDVVTRDRSRTGERVRLSALRGQPVGLVFGSYT